jgi:hypothetical protein
MLKADLYLVRDESNLPKREGSVCSIYTGIFYDDGVLKSDQLIATINHFRKRFTKIYIYGSLESLDVIESNFDTKGWI